MQMSPKELCYSIASCCRETKVCRTIKHNGAVDILVGKGVMLRLTRQASIDLGIWVSNSKAATNEDNSRLVLSPEQLFDYLLVCLGLSKTSSLILVDLREWVPTISINMTPQLDGIWLFSQEAVGKIGNTIRLMRSGRILC